MNRGRPNPSAQGLSVRLRKGAGFAFAAAILFACESANASAGSDSPVGKWAGRYQLEELGITINMLMDIAANHAYRVDAMPNIAGLDTVHVYEEIGTWT